MPPSDTESAWQCGGSQVSRDACDTCLFPHRTTDWSIVHTRTATRLPRPRHLRMKQMTLALSRSCIIRLLQLPFTSPKRIFFRELSSVVWPLVNTSAFCRPRVMQNGIHKRRFQWDFPLKRVTYLITARRIRSDWVTRKEKLHLSSPTQPVRVVVHVEVWERRFTAYVPSLDRNPFLSSTHSYLWRRTALGSHSPTAAP